MTAHQKIIIHLSIHSVYFIHCIVPNVIVFTSDRQLFCTRQTVQLCNVDYRSCGALHACRAVWLITTHFLLFDQKLHSIDVASSRSKEKCFKKFLVFNNQLNSSISTTYKQHKNEKEPPSNPIKHQIRLKYSNKLYKRIHSRRASPANNSQNAFCTLQYIAKISTDLRW